MLCRIPRSDEIKILGLRGTKSVGTEGLREPRCRVTPGGIVKTKRPKHCYLSQEAVVPHRAAGVASSSQGKGVVVALHLVLAGNLGSQ
jgi:hypothetical protein